MSFWMLELNAIREDSDGREYTETDIDSGFGYFLTEQDAHNFLDEQGLSYNVRDKPLLDKYTTEVTNAKRKFSRAKTAYNKARAAGVPRSARVDPVMDHVVRETPQSWYEPVEITVNEATYGKEEK
jgi:hypothetical protein